MTRKEPSVRKAAEQEFATHAPDLDGQPRLAGVLKTLILRKGDQPLPFRDKATREFDDRRLCILD